MVVDHVEDDHQPEAVRGVDQRLQLVRRAVGAVRRVGQHAVIAPIVPAREIGDRHDLDRGDAEALQLRQVLLDAAEAAHGAGVQFVDHGLVPGPALPVVVLPLVVGRDRRRRSGRARPRPAGATPGRARAARPAARTGSACRPGRGRSARASRRARASMPRRVPPMASSTRLDRGRPEAEPGGAVRRAGSRRTAGRVCMLDAHSGLQDQRRERRASVRLSEAGKPCDAGWCSASTPPPLPMLEPP